MYGSGPATPGAPRFAVAYDFWGGNASLPAYRIGDTFVPTALLLSEGHTTAPALLTETELLTLMDANGIGTDATQAAHIAKVCDDRGYARKLADGRLEPTRFGEALVAAYERIGMVSALITIPIHLPNPNHAALLTAYSNLRSRTCRGRCCARTWSATATWWPAAR